ncbi:MAG: hypothetical protein ACOZCO_08065 [Bacteroidota bacterium]
METVLDTPFVHLEIKDGIMVGYYKANKTITLDIAKEIARERYETFGRLSYPVLIFDKGVHSIDKAARDFFASKEGNIGVTAGAVVVKSSFTMMMVNFIFQISRPVIPCKIFTDEEKAIVWLNKYKNSVR